MEAWQSFGIAGKLLRNYLDGYVAAELAVVGLMDFAHAASVNLRQDFVGAAFRASGELHHFFPVGTFCFEIAQVLGEAETDKAVKEAYEEAAQGCEKSG